MWKAVCRGSQMDTYSSPCTRLNSKCTKDFNLKPDILNLSKVENTLDVIGTEGFLNRRLLV